jgi:hypothetical protein
MHLLGHVSGAVRLKLPGHIRNTFEGTCHLSSLFVQLQKLAHIDIGVENFVNYMRSTPTGEQHLGGSQIFRAAPGHRCSMQRTKRLIRSHEDLILVGFLEPPTRDRDRQLIAGANLDQGSLQRPGCSSPPSG